MTTAQVGIVVVYAFIVAVWPIRLLVLHIILRRQCTTHQSPRYDQQSPPLVSAILPAKDEEAYLALCLESIRKLTYPNLEILVVDDRSTDRTGDIAREIASTDERIRVITIDELPPGWTGKTHALERASHMAHGQWLLFVDADTIHAPDSLGIVMEYARSQQAVLASLLPELRCESFWERVMQPIAAITLMQSFPLHKINDNRSKLAFANGQYILIARQAYDAAGGHKAVRDRFVEDIALAQRVKALGFPIRAGARSWCRDVSNVRILGTAHQGLEPHLLRRAGSQFMAAHEKTPRSDHLLPDRTAGIGGRLHCLGTGWRTFRDIAYLSECRPSRLHVLRISASLSDFNRQRYLLIVVPDRKLHCRSDLDSSYRHVLDRKCHLARNQLRRNCLGARFWLRQPEMIRFRTSSIHPSRPICESLSPNQNEFLLKLIASAPLFAYKMGKSDGFVSITNLISEGRFPFPHNRSSVSVLLDLNQGNLFFPWDCIPLTLLD